MKKKYCITILSQDKTMSSAFGRNQTCHHSISDPWPWHFNLVFISVSFAFLFFHQWYSLKYAIDTSLISWFTGKLRRKVKLQKSHRVAAGSFFFLPFISSFHRSCHPCSHLLSLQRKNCTNTGVKTVLIFGKWNHSYFKIMWWVNGEVKSRRKSRYAERNCQAPYIYQLQNFISDRDIFFIIDAPFFNAQILIICFLQNVPSPP